MLALVAVGVLAALLTPFEPAHLLGEAPWVDTPARKAATGVAVALAYGVAAELLLRRRTLGWYVTLALCGSGLVVSVWQPGTSSFHVIVAVLLLLPSSRRYALGGTARRWRTGTPGSDARV